MSIIISVYKKSQEMFKCVFDDGSTQWRSHVDGVEPSLQSYIDSAGEIDDIAPLPDVADESSGGGGATLLGVSARLKLAGDVLSDIAQNVSLASDTGDMTGILYWTNNDSAPSEWLSGLAVGEKVVYVLDGVEGGFEVDNVDSNINVYWLKLTQTYGEPFPWGDLASHNFILNPNYDVENLEPLVEGDTVMLQAGEWKPINLLALIAARDPNPLTFPAVASTSQTRIGKIYYSSSSISIMELNTNFGSDGTGRAEGFSVKGSFNIYNNGESAGFGSIVPADISALHATRSNKLTTFVVTGVSGLVEGVAYSVFATRDSEIVLT